MGSACAEGRGRSRGARGRISAREYYGESAGWGDCRPKGRCDRRCCDWAAYVTQAGITLGLSDEIAASFPAWGPSLQAPLVSAIVLSQLVGPPLLKAALLSSGECRGGADGADVGGGGAGGRDDSARDDSASTGGGTGGGAVAALDGINDDFMRDDVATRPFLASADRRPPRRTGRNSRDFIASVGEDAASRAGVPKGLGGDATSGGERGLGAGSQFDGET